MAMIIFARRLSEIRPLVTLKSFQTSQPPCRGFSTGGDDPKGIGSTRRYALAGGILAALGAAIFATEELETRKALATLEGGGTPAAIAAAASSDALLLDRPQLQRRLVDLLSPYVCSMSHVDLLLGPVGSGRSSEVRRASAKVPNGGSLYVDLNGGGAVGTAALEVLTRQHGRGLLHTLRDVLWGGREAHGLKILEAAVTRFLQKHERYPVVVFDHVDPGRCGLGNPTSPLLQLGRRNDPEAPSLRAVLVLDDASLEILARDAHPSSDFRVVAVGDASREEAAALLLRNQFPRELAHRVAELVGGRLSHLREAMSYWADSPRWLSPMRPGNSQQDYAASIDAHFAEIKKIIYWELDKRLRISAGIGLWPSATGDAPVTRQSPTDEDSVQILELLSAISSQPLPASEVRAAIGETRFLQLLRAQVLGFEPLDGPLEKRSRETVTFGSPAMRRYFEDRLAGSVSAAAESALADQNKRSWSSLLFGGT